MSWHPGRRYGRWEGLRAVRGAAGEGGFNALLLLWPVAGTSGRRRGRLDGDPVRRPAGASFFLHYGPDNDQDHGSVQHDSTRWSAYALGGRRRRSPPTSTARWYTNTETDHFPPRPMNMTMQLDYFGNAGGPTAMHGLGEPVGASGERAGDR
ncbi:hypothetical protein HBB16_16890 [Pseudonocardia sp. MCCB 268]|nr:hypothetical protein [Pseudonocardia cytotoxica]